MNDLFVFFGVGCRSLCLKNRWATKSGEDKAQPESSLSFAFSIDKNRKANAKQIAVLKSKNNNNNVVMYCGAHWMSGRVKYKSAYLCNGPVRPVIFFDFWLMFVPEKYGQSGQGRSFAYVVVY